MPVPPVPQETSEESNSGFKLEPGSPVASLKSMKASQEDPNNAPLPPIVVDFEMENKASTSNAVFKKTANVTTGNSCNGNKSSSSQEPAGKCSDMTKKELIAHLGLSEEITQAMTKDQQIMIRMSFLYKEIEKLTKEFSDFRRKADAEQTGAEDVFEKYSITTFFNKVGEESTTPWFFKEKHYEESMKKIKTETDKTIRDPQNDLRD